MKKNKKIKEEFSKHDLMFPDLTQIKLEQAQLKAHERTSEYIGNILQVLFILTEKIKNIENILTENKKGK